VAELYRLTFEIVSQTHLHLYCNGDPMFYKNVTQTVPNSEIPDEHWQEVSKEDSNPWQQYNALRQWAGEDRGFVRNVRLEKQVSMPEWEPVEEVGRAE
jgi:hypothetical protein